MANQSSLNKEAREAAQRGKAEDSKRQQGDNRTPDKTIGQVKYADHADSDKQQRQGKPTTPEKQGGFGGP